MSENTTARLTAYGAAKLVNVRLAEEGLKAIPPQMVYNYTTARIRAGKAPFIKYTEKTGVDAKDLQRWTDEYVAKKVAKVTEAVEATEATETVEG
jgi:hypothetical protein